jgi:peptidoglycan/xylan/chitin deacetylase (PgdA/CDA1 family)
MKLAKFTVFLVIMITIVGGISYVRYYAQHSLAEAPAVKLEVPIKAPTLSEETLQQKQTPSGPAYQELPTIPMPSGSLVAVPAVVDASSTPLLGGRPQIMASTGPMISFNFDDGFISAYDIAFPMLEKASINFTDYIITSYFNTKGYMSKEQVLDLQARGHEIGAHTRTHPHLSQLSLDQAWNEIAGSKLDLESIGIKNVATFAYPYGDDSPAIEALVKAAGFSGARKSWPGLDDRSTDRYQLLRQRVQSDTTFNEVKNTIDQAIKEKRWAILVFHRIDESGAESASHEMLQQIIDYVKQKKIRVVTMADGLKELSRMP